MSTPDTFTELLADELTPEPSAEFAREMDEWVAAGLPRRRQRPRRSAAWLARASRSVRTPGGMAVASTAVAGLVIALLLVADSVQQSGTGSPQSQSADAARTTAPEPASDEL